MAGAIHVGTSGWSYRHWENGAFYPRGLPKGEQLPFYAERFGTVEINKTFYQLAKPHVMEGWRDAVPDGFVFAVKGSRFVTHMKKLKEPEEPVRRFFEPLDPLREKMGPVLWQLPPRWDAPLERLEAFLDALPDGHRYVMEFRDARSFRDEVYDLLRERGAAFCIYGQRDWTTPIEVTSDLVYVRFHGWDAMFDGWDRAGEALDWWARRVRRWSDEGLDVFVYFNNDNRAHAVRDGLALAARLAPEAAPAARG